MADDPRTTILAVLGDIAPEADLSSLEPDVAFREQLDGQMGFVVAAADVAWVRSLKWTGPTDAAKSGQFRLNADEDWLNGDQSATRK